MRKDRHSIFLYCGSPNILENDTNLDSFPEKLSGTGDSQHDSHEFIRANHSQLKPLFL